MKTERRYDNAGRLTYLSNELSSGEPVARFEYSLNPTNTISEIMKTFTRPDHGQVGRYVLQYTYDALDRLITASTDGTFQYDELGNQLQRGGDYNEFNQLLSDNDAIYTYTQNGQLKTKTSKSTGEKTEYTWDAQDKLVQVLVKNSDGSIKKSVLHRYDGIDRRAQRITKNGSNTLIRKHGAF